MGAMLFVFLLSMDIVSPQIKETFKSALLPGDIILGGLFPVHGTETEFCKKINPDRGIQRLEAMIFTIQEINSRFDILPNINLGARILDTCSKDTYALEQSLDFIKSSLADTNDASDYFCKDGGEVLRHSNASQKIRTVVGGSYSSVSILVANLLKLFSIPQISYASTSAVLSDKKNHPFFARTLPSDQQQAKAMATLVAYYNWTFVSTVRSSGDYGDSGIDAFWKESKKLGVCIGAKEMIKPNPSTSDLLNIVRTLYKEFQYTRVIVLFTRLDHTKLLMNAVHALNLTNYFVWIASDGWGSEYGPVANNSQVTNGAITFEVKSLEITNFTRFYHNLRYNNPFNPWFKEYWEELFDCYPDQEYVRHKRSVSYGLNKTANLHRYRRFAPKRNKKTLCSKHRMTERLKNFKQESKIQSVYDAVYAVAYALHSLQERLCVPFVKEKCIRTLNNVEGMEFYKSLINGTFYG